MAIKRPDPYLKGLEEEKAVILSQIKELNARLRVVDSLIIKQKAVALGKAENIKVTKKNTNELFYSGEIYSTISANGPLSSKEIYSHMIKSGHQIKYSTLRSYLHRLGLRQTLTRHPDGRWRIRAISPALEPVA